MLTGRRAWAAAAAGLVLMMTGCSTEAPQGDDLYAAAETRYMAMADTMHKVLMSVHEGEWTIPFGGYGAVPISCDPADGGDGYSFSYRRTVQLDDIDAHALSGAAHTALGDAGFDPQDTVFGSGDAAEWNVIAEDDDLGRVVVTIRPGRGDVQVALDGSCAPGDANELGAMVTDDEHDDGQSFAWQRLPATEGPDSVPQFYFPADGPLYFNKDDSLVEPQPLVTDPPKAPYGA